MPDHIGMKECDTLIAPFNNHPLVDCNIYHWGKGGFRSITQEIEGSFTGTMPIICEDRATVDELIEKVKDYYSPHRIKYAPLSWEDVVSEKDDNTSMGLPLGTEFKDHKEFLDTFEDLTVLYEELSKAEDLVLQRNCPVSFWKAMAKEDKYSTKKVQTNRFRMVSIGSYFLLCLCRRWLSPIDKHMKEIIRQFHLIGDESHYQRNVLTRLQGLFTIGVDYTAYDKNSARYFVIKSMQLLHFMSGQQTPQPIIEYIILNIANPYTILMNKDTGTSAWYHLAATNPSGQYHTSNVNSITHLYHNVIIINKIGRAHV